MNGRIKLRITVKSYKDAVERIRALDLILFSDMDPVSSTIKIIQKMSSGNGDFSHVGVVVNKALMPYVEQMKEGRLYVMESTFSHKIEILGKKIVNGPSDALTGEGKFGVQIRDLEEVVKNYGGKVFRGRILNNPWVFYKGEKLEDVQERRGKIISKMSEIYEKHYGKGYNFGPFHLLGVVCPKVRFIRNRIEPDHGTKAVICSELVAIIYRQVGVISQDVDPRDTQPTDFDGSDADNEIDNILCDHLIQLAP